MADAQPLNPNPYPPAPDAGNPYPPAPAAYDAGYNAYNPYTAGGDAAANPYPPAPQPVAANPYPVADQAYPVANPYPMADSASQPLNPAPAYGTPYPPAGGNVYDQPQSAAPYAAYPPDSGCAPGSGSSSPRVGEPVGPPSSFKNPLGSWADLGSYRDVWFAVLWVIVTVGFAVKGFMIIMSDDNELTRASEKAGNRNKGSLEASPIVVACGLSIVLTVLATVLIRQHPVFMIWACGILCIVCWLGLAGLFLALKSLVAAIMCLLVALMNACFLWCFSDRIPFAALCLGNAARINLRYWGTYIVALVMTGVVVGLTVVYFFIIVEGKSADDIKFPFGIFGWVTLFVMYWMDETIKNVIHVTTVGVSADWFFALGGPGTPPMYQTRTRYPAVGAFRRAMTWSLGSICLGSLFVAILRLIHTALKQMMRRNDILGCIVLCIMGLIERLMEYFNDYAFVQVGVYGKPYITAAKNTWDLIRSGEVWAAMINDSLVDSVFFVVVLLTGAISTLVVYATKLHVSCFIDEDGDEDCSGSMKWMNLAISALLALMIAALFMKLLYSSVMTMFICYADLEENGHTWQSQDIGGDSGKIAAGFKDQQQVVRDRQAEESDDE